MAEQMTEVPFLDLRAAYVELKTELDDAYQRVMDRGWFILGPELAQFEAEFAKSAGAEHCIGVGSGLDALTLALRAYDVGVGDEVIVPSFTFIATWLAVSATGATPIAVEPDPLTYNMTAAAIEPFLTPRTRAIVPVHLYGQPTDIRPIIESAHARDVLVIADAAQAHGAAYHGAPLGHLGDAVCWSFYPGKNLGAFGDGGAVTTDSCELDERLRLLRNYGSRERYEHGIRGVNSRLDELQAAFLRVRLHHLEDWNLRRRSIADLYRKRLTDLERVTLPEILPDVTSAWHLFVIRHPQRDELQRFLAERGIQSLIHYPVPPHRQRAYAQMTETLSLPIADQLASEVLSLPIGPQLSVSDAERVIDEIASFESGAARSYNPRYSEAKVIRPPQSERQ